MPFEAFLSEKHSRPKQARRLGYVASFVMHAPPVAAFTVAWLTQAFVIGSPNGVPDLHEQVPYRIPMALWNAARGIGGTPGGGAALAAGAAAAPKAGGEGIAFGMRQRALTSPAQIEPFPVEAGRDSEYAYEGFVAADEVVPEPDPGVPEGLGQGISGVAEGDLGLGSGDGAGASGVGPGGLGGDGAQAGGIVAADEPPKTKKRAAQKKTEGDGVANQGPGDGDGGERADAVVVGPPPEQTVPLPSKPAVRASYISQQMAAYFRTYETFPGLPESYWTPGLLEMPLRVQICVSTEGVVSDVTFKESTNAEVDQLVGRAIKSWRYRPRVVSGAARPFCHPMVITYSRAARVFR